MSTSNPTFTRRHYEHVARYIREYEFTPAPVRTLVTARTMFINIMAAMFERDNPSFNEARFRRACEKIDDN